MTHARLFLARHVPPTVPPNALVALTVAFAVLSIARGADYATADKPAGGSLQLLDAFPGGIRLWGLVLLVAGVHLVAAYLLRIHLAVWWGHIALAAVYAGMAAAVARAGSLGQSWAPILVPLGGVAWHVYVAKLTGPLPPCSALTNADD